MKRLSYRLRRGNIFENFRTRSTIFGNVRATENYIRFEKHGDIYKDLACLSPLNFHEVMPSDALEKHSIALQRFDPDTTKDQLQGELLSLARNWVHLKVTLFEEYPIVRENKSDDEESNKDCIPQETYLDSATLNIYNRFAFWVIP